MKLRKEGECRVAGVGGWRRRRLRDGDGVLYHGGAVVRAVTVLSMV